MMTPTLQRAGTNHRAAPQTLAQEHADLLRDVRRRAGSVLALAERRAWPHAELATLTGFLRTTLLRQASDEEARLFPADASAPPLIELNAEHARLYALTEELERAYRDGCDVPELRRLLDRLLGTLEHHLAEEERTLAALAGTDLELPAVAALTDGPFRGDPVVIDLDPLPDEVAVRAGIERVLRLRPGERARIRTAHSRQVQQICAWLHEFDASRFGFDRAESSDGSVRLEVSCRRPS